MPKAEVVTLDTPLAETPLIGDSFAATLSKQLGIDTVRQLLQHYPHRYEDRTSFKDIADVKHGEAVTVMGDVVSIETVPTRSKLVITKVALRDATGIAFLTFFGNRFVKAAFEKLKERQIIAYGKASRRSMGRGLELTEVEWETYDAATDAVAANRIVPVYPLSEGVTQQRMRKLVWAASDAYSYLFDETLPADLLVRLGLSDMATTMREIHFPANDQMRAACQRRLTFYEFYCLQLILVARKRQADKQPGTAFPIVDPPIEELIGALPYSLTGAQRRVIGEIAVDMQAQQPMNRLIQGDVGAGKTVVAMAALLVAVRNGYQAAIMAPTEILAEQHYLNIHRALEELGVRVVLLTGSMSDKAKALNLQAIAGGEVHIAVGTHALIQHDVEFHKLGFAVVDEQHRFGVLQRAALRLKGTAPDILVMTATPIPRTLTLTVYGDLDISIIDELPPGRKPIRTHWKRNSERPQVYETLRGLLKQGRQAYVICPLVLESEKLQARAATELALHLENHVYPEYKVGLLHGQMKASEKEDAMQRFRRQEIQILVSTTVIEVGVDVPNASVIVIEDADRFGLAQLHQLRGRVGRGDTQSYCLLIADPKTDDGIARMEIMTATTDGFRIAEEDLKLRGPGDFYGTRQSGVQSLPFLDIFRDVPVLHSARAEAIATLDVDPKLQEPRHAALKADIQSRMRTLASVSGTN
jgi:ATP-dependent DNA helicase RecG